MVLLLYTTYGTEDGTFLESFPALKMLRYEGKGGLRLLLERKHRRVDLGLASLPTAPA